jgi:uncharacterized membrane protein
LEQIFAVVCGQNPDHTWKTALDLMPCCQRCTGLYVGAFLSIALHLWLKPSPGAAFLKWHGLALLVMVPFGFHWLPQGPGLRSFTGVLFGAGVVTFLWLPLAARRSGQSSARAAWTYWALLLGGGLVLPWLGASGSGVLLVGLTGMVCTGAAGLAALAVVGPLAAAWELLGRRGLKEV